MLTKKKMQKIQLTNYAIDTNPSQVKWIILGCNKEWRNATYCLSLISHNEKSLRKMMEHFDGYRDKLYDEIIY